MSPAGYPAPALQDLQSGRVRELESWSPATERSHFREPNGGGSTTSLRSLREARPPSEAEQLIEALKALHPDELSPRDALEALYALKAKLPKQ